MRPPRALPSALALPLQALAGAYACSSAPAAPPPAAAPEPAPGSEPAHVRVTTGDADPAARAVAEATLARMGGAEAWEATRYIHWKFFGRREHWWDKATGDVRIDAGDALVLMNVNTRAGRAWKDGAEVVDPAERDKLLEAGYAWWVNDSYWLVMPYKLLDPGVILRDKGPAALPDGRPAHVLELTFDAVGLTPENRYEVYVADATQLVEHWAYYEKASDTEPGMETEWSGWQPFGRIWLATSRGRGFDWDISVHDDLPRTLFTSPDKPAS
jgi:hypothetical protein